jgi:hypothetical protein
MLKHRRLAKDPKTGKYRPVTVVARSHWSEHLADFYKDELFQFYFQFVDEGTELRKKLLEKTFIGLVKKRYVEEYLKTNPENPSVKGFQEFVKRDYASSSEETAAAILKKQGFKIVDSFFPFSEYYTIVFEYRDGELIYDDIHADEVFDEIWRDIDLILEFVSKHIGFIVGASRGDAELFKQYLMEDAEAYPNSNEIIGRIKEIFLPLEFSELVEDIRKDLLEEMRLPCGGRESSTALELFVEEEFNFAFSGIVPYEDTRQTLRQPFTEQHGLKLWTAMYEKSPLPPKSIERIRRFLMTNFYELFLYLIPHEILSSKKLEQDINNGNTQALEFKAVMTDFLNSLNPPSIFITEGGYGKASYMLTPANLSVLYADELALREAYRKFSHYPQIKGLFTKLYRWTKDLDAAMELENSLNTRKEKERKRYLYSYEEEEKQKDDLPRRLLKKNQQNVTPEESELMLEATKAVREMGK